MDLVLKAIKARLTDTQLNTIVPKENITTSYVGKIASYPCIILGIKSESDMNEIPGVERMVLSINVYSSNNKQECWTIYKRVKELLNNCEREIKSSSRILHLVREAYYSDEHYDYKNNIWELRAVYNIICTTSGTIITTGASGIIYGDPMYVSAEPTKEIAKFRGELSLEIEFESEIRKSRNRFGTEVVYRVGRAKLVIDEVVFKPSVIDLLWNVSLNTTDYLNDGSTMATTYKISQSSYPKSIKVLYQAVKTDDGKKLEIEASNAYCNSLRIPFYRADFTIINCEWMLLADVNNNVVKVAVEN